MKRNGGEIYAVTWGTERIQFRLGRSSRRMLAITVRPDQAVVVTAPRKVTLEAVKVKVRKRAGWIRGQQSYFGDFLPQTPPRGYVGGETHRYLGWQYRLKIIEAGKDEVKLKDPFILVHTPREGDTTRVRKLVGNWYLAHAKKRLARSFAESTARMGTRLANSPRMQLRRMKRTR